MDTQRLILLVIFSFSLLMLWEAWEKENRPKPPPAPPTAQQGIPVPAKPAAPQGTVTRERLVGVFRAARMEAAGRRQQRPQEPLIAAHYGAQRAADHGLRLTRS